MSNTISGNQLKTLTAINKSIRHIRQDDVEQLIADCINGAEITPLSFAEDNTSVYLNINDSTLLSLEGAGNRVTIEINKAILSDDQLNKIRSLDTLHRKEQNRLALEMIRQSGAHKHEYPLSITIWNRVPGSKKMTSRTFNKDYLNEETLEVLRDHT